MLWGLVKYLATAFFFSEADFLCVHASSGVRHSRVHRPRGDPASGLREAGGLVGDGSHPV